MERERIESEYIEDDEEIEYSGGDLVNAIAYYKAKEAGLIEDIGMPDSSYGVLGAMASDVLNATVDYFDGKINEEEMESSIDKAVISGFTAIVVSTYDTVSKAVGSIVKSKLPSVLHPVVNGAIKFVREKVVKGAVKLVEKGWNLLKSSVKKLFA